MGLVPVVALFGNEMARVIQLAIEYDRQSPFDSGAPSKVAPELLAMVQQLFS